MEFPSYATFSMGVFTNNKNRKLIKFRTRSYHIHKQANRNNSAKNVIFDYSPSAAAMHSSVEPRTAAAPHIFGTYAKAFPELTIIVPK